MNDIEGVDTSSPRSASVATPTPVDAALPVKAGTSHAKPIAISPFARPHKVPLPMGIAAISTVTSFTSSAGTITPRHRRVKLPGCNTAASLFSESGYTQHDDVTPSPNCAALDGGHYIQWAPEDGTFAASHASIKTDKSSVWRLSMCPSRTSVGSGVFMDGQSYDGAGASPNGINLSLSSQSTNVTPPPSAPEVGAITSSIAAQTEPMYRRDDWCLACVATLPPKW